uniref:Sialate O-acetylesterase domain-containing protein n=1 Tax=Tetraselmis chuii TaxID=63592 RepID=A0A7S1T517_9CHLO|mmetsp:Transcript_41980/g.75362  ORF Transcript_41980/g.75362 Transcript_41980/m.75362 type:complete len:310 (+) Transcript_41980:401-1330(+)
MSNWTGALTARETGWSCFSFVAPMLPAFSETAGEPTVDTEPLDVFILGGQSNMAGRGGVIQTKTGKAWDGVLPPSCEPAPGQILKFNGAGKWEDAQEPLHIDIDTTKVCGVGPGLAFANELRNMGYTNRIGLVPCAIGGTRVDLWEDGGKLFTNMVHRAFAALAERPNSRLCGLLWFQGESDADTIERATTYGKKSERLLSSFRTAFNAPNLPIVQVAVTSTREEVPYVDHVRKGQLSIQLSNLATVDARGYHLPDGFHLSTYAHCKLAKEMAEAFLLNFRDPPAAAQEMDAPPVDDMQSMEKVRQESG